MFLVTATSHVVIAGYAIYRTTRRAPIPGSLREAYRTVPNPRASTPQTAALDPRAEEVSSLPDTVNSAAR